MQIFKQVWSVKT